MIKIRVKFFGPFRELFGGREMAVDFPEGTSLRQLLERLCDSPDRERETYSHADGLAPGVIIMIDGKPVPTSSGLETPLREGNVVAVFPFLGGG